LGVMPQPIFVRPPTEAERQELEAGLRSGSAFVLRRCQALLASARGDRVPQIACALGCDEQTVRNAIHAFNATGLAALDAGSSRPHTIQAALDPEGTERLRALLHQSPRNFGKPTSLWTLDLAAEVCLELGITDRLVTGETIRATLVRMGVRWLRAKEWITSPDPAYARKKGCATA
jgi:transposase